MGDLNAHTLGFASTANESGNVLANFIYESRASILNTNRDATSIRLSEGACNTLDYFIGSQLFLECLEEFKVDSSSILIASERIYFHIPIMIEFKLRPERRVINKSKHKNHLTTPRPTGRNLKQP
jgi:hypothetical protein